MTDKISPAQLKNRILGAILLVILAVLIIPLFLGDAKESTYDSRPTGDFKSKITPLPGAIPISKDKKVVIKRTFQPKPEVQIATPAIKTKQAKLAKPKSKPVATPKKKPEVKKVAKKVAKKPKPKVAKPSDDGKWALQVGIFSKRSNAEAIANIIKSNGFAPKLTQFEASFGEATRVWVGPFASKLDAQVESDKLKAKTGDGGYVAPLPFESK